MNAYELFDFTFITERDGTQKPHFYICGKVHVNGSMKPGYKLEAMPLTAECRCKI